MELKHSNRGDLSGSNASNDEEALVKGLKKKEDSAYRALIDRWGGKLYQLAYRFVRNEQEAQELLQEVLTKVIEKIDFFKGDSSLYTWLYRITVNQALMRIRKDKGFKQTLSWEEVAPKYEDGIMVTKIPDWAKLPDVKFQEEETKELLKKYVEELPEEMKIAYVLKDVEELSEADVCGILEISKPAMKNRVHRARLFIRKRMEDYLLGKDKG